MKKSLALMLALIMALCMIPTTAFAKSSSASLTVIVSGTFYNPNTDKHQYFSNLSTTTHVKVNEGENPSYPVKYYFTKQTYSGSTNSSYYGKEGYKLIVTIGDKESTDLKAWVFDRDMTNVKGDGQTFHPIYSPGGYGTYENTLSISGGTPIQPETGTLTINKNVTGLPNDKLPASFTFKVMQGNNVKATVTVNKNGNNGYNAGSATLPHGTYTVVEVSATVDGYTVVTTPSNGEVTISGQPTNITFTNAYTKNETQPETPPTKPEPENTSKPVAGLTGKEVVRVECTTTNSSHAANTYPLIAGSYTVGEVSGDKEKGYTCDITVNPNEYVEAYNTDIGVNHTLAPVGQTGTITLRWKPDVGEDGTGTWKVYRGVPVVFTVKCDTTVPDSVSAVTKTRLTDVANVPLPRGVDINVEPVVTFTDNNTSATLLYEFKVTGTPGAEVVIKDTGATFIDNGNPVDDKITVTLPAAVGNETETSTTVYGYRTFSVDDIQNGKLVNNATANVTNGDPDKDKTDTEDVPALDNRTLDNTLTVKKLVSGNAANTTEKFTFKATFTFPVPGASANPDGVTSGEKVEIIFELAHGQTKTFSYTSDPELKAKIDKMKESGSLSGDGDAVFAMLSYKVEETNAKGYTLATSGDAEGKAEGHNTVTFTNTKNKPNDDHGGHYHPTTTPVPVIVIPPKTGDMPFWYSIAQFLGLVK